MGHSLFDSYDVKCNVCALLAACLCVIHSSFLALCYVLYGFFCMWLSTNVCTSQRSCVVYPKHNMWPWLKVDYFNCSKIWKCLHPPYPPSPCHLSRKQMESNGILWILGAQSCCFRISRIWMVWPRQSGIPGWEIRGFDLSGCTLCKVCEHTRGNSVHAHLQTQN